ncbi:hypothetical protein AVDCRST_MAG81-498 [uncultured Synechococcales cyanobacterium]|uniref:Uncharacterized protein n=1 Tax=uncultured Synechococcales cyanobacterium TaxID=1936017 RepID=A0A6J4US51_9CYAN|nr:hypothetical protein AVDCRST_MAG81-498 [uncultured Synechococcales cyanobacterium]
MARLKIINNFDGSFVLDPDAKQTLFSLLKGESFMRQVAEQVHCQRVEFTELVFQPVPYSQATPKGMPALYEQYHKSSDYAIINVPPNFMFKAKVFNPNRLCAIYRKVQSPSQ